MKRVPKTGLLLMTLALVMIATAALVWLARRPEPPRPLNRQEQLDRDLITAIYDQNGDRVVTLLRKGADPNARGYWDKRGRWDEARHQRVWEPSRNTGGPTALMLAVYAGGTDMARALLGRGADVNARDDRIDTALMCAGRYGNTDGANLLLDHGADVKPDIFGEDPLPYAVTMEDAALVRRLLARGAKINRRDRSGDTPLLSAAGVAAAPMVRLLLKEGAQVNVRNGEGDTALLLAVKAHGGADRQGDWIMDRAYVSPAQQIDTVRALLDYGADVTARDKQGRSPLQIATERSLTQIVNLLKKARAHNTPRSDSSHQESQLNQNSPPRDRLIRPHRQPG